MPGFYDELNNTLNHSDSNKILTTNGAVAYASAGDSLVDFAYSVNSLRNKSIEEIMARFEQCYIDNPLMATKMMFQIGDVREGKGERRTFNACLRYMALAHPEVAMQLLPLVPEYTRWDHVAEMVIHANPQVRNFARNYIIKQLRKDYATALLIDADNEARGKLTEELEDAPEAYKASIQAKIDAIPHRQLSLCAKWVPALGSKEPGHHKIALKLSQTLNKDKKIGRKEYRTMRTKIISHLNVVEQYMSAKKMHLINFEHMTSAQQLRYADAMQKNRGEEYDEYLDKVAAGEAKMNTAVLTPNDVVHRYTSYNSWGSKPTALSFDKTLETAWNQLPRPDIHDGFIMVVRDDSGSMAKRVSDKSDMRISTVATSLAIYCAELLPGEYNGKFISFSANPKYLNISGFETLHDKLQYAYSHSEVANTNIEKTFDLVLQTAIDNNLKQEDLPSCMLILSDMEFDEGVDMEVNQALMEHIREKWNAAGYQLPTLAYWNLNVDRAILPSIDDRGVVLLSGFSTNNLDMVLSGELAQFTPAKQLEYLLSQPRYDAVAQAYYEGIELEEYHYDKNPDRVMVSFAEYLPQESYPYLQEEEITPSVECDDHDDEEWDW